MGGDGVPESVDELLFYCPRYKHIREQHDFFFGLDHGSIRLLSEAQSRLIVICCPLHSPMVQARISDELRTLACKLHSIIE